MEEKSDWNISELYEKAWAITKKYKTLWIFGAMFASLASGSSFNGNFPSDSDSLEKIFNNPSDTPEKVSQVLGAATSSPFAEMTQNLFTNVPLPIYLILGLSIAGLVIYGIVLSLISKAYAEGSLLAGIQNAIKGQEVSISTSSQTTFPRIKSLIWLYIIPMLVIFITVMALTVLFVILIIAEPTRIIGIILAIVALILYLVFYLWYSIANIWAVREVMEGKSAKESLFAGFRIAKKKLGASLLLGILNAVISGLVIGIPMIILFALIFGFVFAGVLTGKDNLPSLIGPFIAIGSIVVITFILLFTFLSATVTTFKAAVWSLAYNKIKGKYDK